MNAGETGSPPWSQVEEVLDRLLEEPESVGDDFLTASAERIRELCGEDRILQEEVEHLLAEAAAEGDLFDRGLARALPDLLFELSDDPARVDAAVVDADRPQGGAPRTIDRYRLIEVLGQGGMGVVYLAERADAEFEKRVAIKVIPRGLESPEKERRFRIERQILARLEHENIARLLDGGVTSEGYPYLAMELVEGEPLDRYCEDHDLSERERIERFLDVCAAVQYAHENLVLHRDLKPSNILVTRDARVKLLDFGVGKILDDADPDQGTRIQPMTPEYASPEQRENAPVSTATDVFSLGLVLRRLLTGVQPTDPEPAGESRLDGDLRVILGRALEESPQRRFRSVGALAADLDRYLLGKPIESRPASLSYRLGKFVTRHRLATVAASVATLLLLIAVTLIAWQGRIAKQERDRARTEAAKAQTVAELLGSLFYAADPRSPSAGELSARELLNRGEMLVLRELHDQPEVKSELLTIIGSAHASLGNNSRGAALLEEAILERRAAHPVDALALADSLRRLAAISYDDGEVESARTALEEASTLLRSRQALESRQGALTLRDLGRVETVANRHDLAEQHFQAALRLLEGHGADVEAAIARTDLAVILDRTGRVEEALRLNQQALETLRLERGEDHPLVIGTRNNIAVILHRVGSYEAAEQLFREAVAAAERAYGSDHPELANSLSNLGKVLMDRGRFEQAAPPIRRAAELRRASSAPDAYNRIAVEMNLAGLELALGNFDPALPLYRSGLERFERLTGAESPPSTRVRTLFGIALHRTGDLPGAETQLRRALQTELEGASGIHRAELRVGLGAVLRDLSRADEAEPLLREALGLYLEALPASHWKVTEARLELAGALLHRNTPNPRGPSEALDLLTLVEAAGLEGPGFEWHQMRTTALRNLAGG